MDGTVSDSAREVDDQDKILSCRAGSNDATVTNPLRRAVFGGDFSFRINIKGISIFGFCYLYILCVETKLRGRIKIKLFVHI
jgi:hypothetical protein